MVPLLFGEHTCSVRIFHRDMNYRQPAAYRHAQDLMTCFGEHGPSYHLTTEDVQWLCFFGSSQQVMAKEQAPGTASSSSARLFLVIN